MNKDCIGRIVKIGDWISYSNGVNVVEVGKITEIVSHCKISGGLKVHPEIHIKGSHSWEEVVSRSSHVCLLEAPFETLDGALSIQNKYKM